MLGDIDYLKKPYAPQLFLAKPNREIIGKLSEAYAIKQWTKVESLNELTFHLPYEIDVHHRLIRNKNIDLIKERYFVKVVLGYKTEWYIINHMADHMESDHDYKEIRAVLLPYELRDKLLREYTADAKGAQHVLSEIMTDTLWRVGTFDPDFELTKRSFDFANTSVLDAIYTVAESYNAVVQWDTGKREVNLLKPEFFGLNRGLKFSYGKYLKTLGKESDADEMVTRLRAVGHDGLGIHRVNPTGQGYIENFSYFMYPFRRDAEQNTIQSSHYMSDGLCHAILDYEERVESKKDAFRQYLAEKEEIVKRLSEREVELDQLKKEYAVITDIRTSQQFAKRMFFERFAYDGVPIASTFRLHSDVPYAVMIKVNSTANLNVALDGYAKYITAGRWTVLGKLKHADQTVVSVSGSSTDNVVFLQIAMISNDEYLASGNDDDLVEKYNFDHKEVQIANKNKEIEAIKTELQQVEERIQGLQDEFSKENNFTKEQIEELSMFIIERDFSDENYIDDQDLYEAALEKFDELRTPRMNVKIDVVNFLSILEEQGNWDKLVLGDEVIVEYERIGVKAKAKITEIEYDYDERNIRLTIANAQQIDDESKKLQKFIYDSKNTNTTVDLNKNKWGKAVIDTGEMHELFENFWNKVTNEINMASNEYVTLDRTGLTIIDPDDRLRFLRATHGALALTRSGGLRYETAITPDGIIAERLMGKVILGERVVLSDPDGTWVTDGPLTTITDRCNREVMKIGLYDKEPDRYGMTINRFETADCGSESIINKIVVDRDDGFKIVRKKGNDWDQVAWLDTEGYFNGRGIRIDYMEGVLNNGITIDSDNGIVITRSDGQVRTVLNATSGISLERWENGWKKKFYADTSGQFYANDLIARRLRIVNDLDDVLLDARTDYLNIGRFETIITDGKLTAVEKLTLKHEWETIQTEYRKLLDQAERYKTADRDGHANLLINIPPFTAAFHDLESYVQPLLADMTVTTPIDRDEFKRKFQNYFDQAQRIMNEITDALKWSSLQLGVPYNKVTIDAINGILVERSDNKVKMGMNAKEGIYIDTLLDDKWERRFYVDTDGRLHAIDLNAERLLLKGRNGKLMIDANENRIDFSAFDMIAGNIEAKNIKASYIAANEGIISDLTVTRLKTRDADDIYGTTINYVDIANNSAKWITGSKKSSLIHATDDKGNLLYYLQGSMDLITTESETNGTANQPIMIPEYDRKVKMELSFEGSGKDSYPRIRMGEGDGRNTDRQSGVGYIEKKNTTFDFIYYTNNSGREIKMSLADNGITNYIDGSPFRVTSTGVAIEHHNGTKMEINAEGNNIKMLHQNGSRVELQSNGDIVISAVGQVKISGSQVHLN
ncbi:hypothetical protein PAE9249_05134 [Paenibacillus sp. CECT 9249]|uniref:phage tail protein n=1 Tax=Paenibacillus sp. CECT 9249 TaxID=2845385 RepID=UPI001E4BD6B4|nr:phage tail protein [Paenibacillus sp. CECT 9249]CAH0122562.1 hypothetical protein PAE9249_05134 [Paenibacillus sp. CECT 9249]